MSYAAMAKKALASNLATLPYDVLVMIFDGMPVEEIIKLRKMSKTMKTQVDQYLHHRYRVLYGSSEGKTMTQIIDRLYGVERPKGFIGFRAPAAEMPDEKERVAQIDRLVLQKMKIPIQRRTKQSARSTKSERALEQLQDYEVVPAPNLSEYHSYAFVEKRLLRDHYRDVPVLGVISLFKGPYGKYYADNPYLEDMRSKIYDKVYAAVRADMEADMEADVEADDDPWSQLDAVQDAMIEADMEADVENIRYPRELAVFLLDGSIDLWTYVYERYTDSRNISRKEFERLYR